MPEIWIRHAPSTSNMGITEIDCFACPLYPVDMLADLKHGGYRESIVNAARILKRAKWDPQKGQEIFCSNFPRAIMTAQLIMLASDGDDNTTTGKLAGRVVVVPGIGEEELGVTRPHMERYGPEISCESLCREVAAYWNGMAKLYPHHSPQYLRLCRHALRGGVRFAMRDGGKECQVVSSDVSLARRHIAAWRSKKEAAPIEVIPIVSHGNFIYNRILSPELKKQGFMNNIETVDFTQGGVAKRSFVPIDYRRLGFHAPSAQQLTRLCTSCKSQLFCGCGHHSDATPRRTLRRPFVSAPSAEAAPSPTPTSTIKGYDDDDDGDDSDENKEKRVVIPPARTSPPVCPKHNGSSPGKDQKIEFPGNNVNAISTGN